MKTFLPILAPAVLVSLLACSGDDDSCFVRGSRVLTPGGWKPIDAIAVGDEVVAYDVDRSEVTVRRVLRVMQRTSERIVRVRAGETIVAGASAEHPFWDAAARELRPAAALSLESRLFVLLPGARVGRELPVDEVAVVPTRGPIDVWNLEVEGEHTYFVEGILVHNKAGGASSHAAQTGVGGAGGAGGDGGGAPGTGGAGGAGGAPGAGGTGG